MYQERERLYTCLLTGLGIRNMPKRHLFIGRKIDVWAYKSTNYDQHRDGNPIFAEDIIPKDRFVSIIVL